MKFSTQGVERWLHIESAYRASMKTTNPVKAVRSPAHAAVSAYREPETGSGAVCHQFSSGSVALLTPKEQRRSNLWVNWRSVWMVT